MSSNPKEANQTVIKKSISDILNIIEQDREKEIISRRFGLNDHKETLEQIGEMLGITRERVRQLEKAILIRLRIAAEDNNINELASAEKLIIRNLTEFGRITKVSKLADRIFGEKAKTNEKAMLYFIGEISPNLTVIDENDKYNQAIGIAEYGNEKTVRGKIDEIVKIIKENKKPISIDSLDEKLNYEHPDHIRALASVSKLLANLNDLWGLTKWPEVNPRNIRDKIFVILEENKKPMHFSEISSAISASDFKRKDVTTQAIHNELIKDSRFVLIGRGIYALDSWGYARGTVTDVIEQVLAEAKEPLFRDEIVKRVLKKRQVKETTVLLNLQSKPQFKRSGKAMYTLAEK